MSAYPGSPQSYPGGPPRRGRSGLLIVLIVLIVLILGAVVALVLVVVNKNGSGPAPAGPTSSSAVSSSPPAAGSPAEAQRTAEGYAQVATKEWQTQGRGTTPDDFAPYACGSLMNTIRSDYDKWKTSPPNWGTTPTSITVASPQINGTSADARYTAHLKDDTTQTGTYQELIENGHWCVNADKPDQS